MALKKHPRPCTYAQALAALQVASAPASPSSTRQRLVATPQMLSMLLGLSCGQQRMPSLQSVHCSGAWTTNQGSGWESEGGDVEQWTTLCLDDAPVAMECRWVVEIPLVLTGGASRDAHVDSLHREGEEDPRLEMALRASETLRNVSALLDKNRLVAMVRYVRAEAAF